MSGVIAICRAFVFGSTFRASWYITATAIGSVLVYLMGRKLNNKWIIVIGCVLYLTCSAQSNYRGLFEGSNILIILDKHYPSMYNSFPVSIIWIAFGKWFAEDRIGKQFHYRVGLLSVLMIVLCLENSIGLKKEFIINDNDCYLLLIPVCILIFDLLLSWEAQTMHASFMRASSTVTYCLHTSLGALIGAGIKRLGTNTAGFPGATITYLLTITACLTLTLLLLRLEKRKNGQWLKAFH